MVKKAEKFLIWTTLLIACGLFWTAILVFATGCSDGQIEYLQDALETEDEANLEPETTLEIIPETVPDLIPTPEPVATLSPEPSQSGAVFLVEKFENGNLWKPNAEGGGATYSGSPVILIRKEYDQFETCKVPLKNGSLHELTCVDDQPWTGNPYSCFHNGFRQHWRARVDCSRIARSEVVCVKGDLILTIRGGRDACRRQG